MFSFKVTTLKRKQSLWSYQRTAGETCPIYHTSTNPLLEQLSKLYWDCVKCCPVWSVSVVDGMTEEVSDSGKGICLGRLHSDFTWVHLLTVTVIFSGLYNFQKLSTFFDITDTFAPPLQSKVYCTKSNQLCQGFGQWHTTSFPLLNFYSCALWHLTWLQMKLMKFSEASLP